MSSRKPAEFGGNERFGKKRMWDPISTKSPKIPSNLRTTKAISSEFPRANDTESVEKGKQAKFVCKLIGFGYAQNY